MYLLFYEKVSNVKGRIDTITRADLVPPEQKINCIEVEFIPEPTKVEGKNAVMYVDIETSSIAFEYVDVILSPDEQVLAKFAEQEQAILELTMILGMMMGGND